MTTLEADVRAWIGDGRVVTHSAFDDVSYFARKLMEDFWSDYPDRKTDQESEAMEQITAIAAVCGFDDPRRFIGSAVIGGNGTLTMTLEVV